MSIGDAYYVHETINHFDIDVNVYGIVSRGISYRYYIYMHNYNKTTDSWHTALLIKYIFIFLWFRYGWAQFILYVNWNSLAFFVAEAQHIYTNSLNHCLYSIIKKKLYTTSEYRQLCHCDAVSRTGCSFLTASVRLVWVSSVGIYIYILFSRHEVNSCEP